MFLVDSRHEWFVPKFNFYECLKVVLMKYWGSGGDGCLPEVCHLAGEEGAMRLDRSDLPVR